MHYASQKAFDQSFASIMGRDPAALKDIVQLSPTFINYARNFIESDKSTFDYADSSPSAVLPTNIVCIYGAENCGQEAHFMYNIPQKDRLVSAYDWLTMSDKEFNTECRSLFPQKDSKAPFLIIRNADHFLGRLHADKMRKINVIKKLTALLDFKSRDKKYFESYCTFIFLFKFSPSSLENSIAQLPNSINIYWKSPSETQLIAYLKCLNAGLPKSSRLSDPTAYEKLAACSRKSTFYDWWKLSNRVLRTYGSFSELKNWMSEMARDEKGEHIIPSEATAVEKSASAMLRGNSLLLCQIKRRKRKKKRRTSKNESTTKSFKKKDVDEKKDDNAEKQLNQPKKKRKVSSSNQPSNRQTEDEEEDGDRIITPVPKPSSSDGFVEEEEEEEKKVDDPMEVIPEEE